MLTIKMQDEHINDISKIKELVKVTNSFNFKVNSLKEKYKWVEEVLGRFKYFSLKKGDKSIIKKYIITVTNLSDPQLTRLIKRKKDLGILNALYGEKNKFKEKYTPEDIALLVKTDNDHERLSGKTTRAIFQREYYLFNKKEYERIKDISVSHVYNLRQKRQYISNSLTFQKTKPTTVPIGTRVKPLPCGKPGYLRVDTVHQGDLDKEKGVYHINLVDEVTQWEIVGCVEKISEYYLEPLLNDALEQFPFKIINFHSDNGSEYINKVVNTLLNKLLISQTKSRPRHSNDNGLAETKNGSVIRKHMGYTFIKHNEAEKINTFYKDYLNIYLNYHRPCCFPEEITDKKGKIKKIYPQKNILTPYEKLKSLPNVEQYLKQNITFDKLNNIAYDKSDNEFASSMKKAKIQLFRSFKQSKVQLPTNLASKSA